MLQNQDIVCFAPGDWWGMNCSCTTHIMLRFAKKNRVLYINPFSSDLFGATKSGITARIIRKLKSTLKFLRQPQKNLYVFSPIFLPLQGKQTIDRLNNFLLKLQIKIVCSFLRISEPLLWVENIRAVDLIDSFQPIVTIYHVSDLFEECNYTANREILRKKERELRGKSDVLICVSKKLYDAKAAQRDNVFYLPHGVDFELFREAANNSNNSIKELADVHRPIAGYYGTLTSHNDIELLQHCATHLRDVSFVLAGQITGGNYYELLKQPNVHFLGRIPYEQIPTLCVCFDVCLLQWKMSKWIRFCNPLKFFEYMASGKPIVSVPIDEIVENYSNVVSVAGTKEEYCNAIGWELNNDTNERARRRIEAAKEHSWDSHFERLSQIITDAIIRKTIE